MTHRGPGELEVILDDIAFGESTRWRDGRVWFCDWVDGAVVSVAPDGSDRVVHARVDGFPISIDWDLDGRLLIVEGAQRRVVRHEPGGHELVADLSQLSDAPWNEIASHRSGRVYVNSVGFDLMAGEPPASGQIGVVDVDGSVRRVADDLAFPNGMAITADGSQLLVAESHASRITSFAITPDGDLGHRSTVAELPGSAPDGLCATADGTVWYADVPNRHCRRIDPNGVVVGAVEADRGCFSCAVSPDGTLFITANIWDEDTFSSRRGVLYRTNP